MYLGGDQLGLGKLFCLITASLHMKETKLFFFAARVVLQWRTVAK
jgi:hypothetical protein